MPFSLRLAVVGGSAALSLAACSPAVTLSPRQIDADWDACRQKIADGAYDPHGSPGHVGFAADRKPAGTPVILYGASWCPACQVAGQYMKQREIPFVEKDVDDDVGAAREGHAALAAAGLPPGKAIPILDVRGTVIVGFNSCALEQAWTAP